MNGEPISETNLKTHVAANEVGKDFVANHPQVSAEAQTAGAAIKNLQDRIRAATPTSARGNFLWDETGPGFSEDQPGSATRHGQEDAVSSQDSALRSTQRALEASRYAIAQAEMEAMRRKLALTTGN